MFRDYFDTMIRPETDGRFIEYVGEADFATKNDLLSNSLGLLFPINWDEPFGLIMIEAMACGTPGLGFSRGSVAEVVKDQVSGFISHSLEEMVSHVPNLEKLDPAGIRRYAQEYFSVERMATEYSDLYTAVSDMLLVSPLKEVPKLTEANLPMA